MSAFDQAVFAKKPKSFQLHNRGPQHQSVQICGSFDNWEERHSLHFDPITVQWYVTLHLKIGEEYLYKYIINENQWGDMLDVWHTGGVWADANQRKLMPCWVMMLTL